MKHALRVWAVLALVAGIALLVALGSGSALIDPLSVPRLLLAPDGSDAAEVLHTLRLPRALSAFATGGLLALAGALMQVLLRKPLADPYVLGISGGAAAGAATLFGEQAATPIDYLDQRWGAETFAPGGPTAAVPPGSWTEFGPLLRRPVGPLHRAGTETADEWTGFMDGAVRSGQRAAAEVAAALGALRN